MPSKYIRYMYIRFEFLKAGTMKIRTFYPDQEASSYLRNVIQYISENTWYFIPENCILHHLPAIFHLCNCVTYVLKAICSIVNNAYAF
jgi:hypothetical protein